MVIGGYKGFCVTLRGRLKEAARSLTKQEHRLTNIRCFNWERERFN